MIAKQTQIRGDQYNLGTHFLTIGI